MSDELGKEIRNMEDAPSLSKTVVEHFSGTSPAERACAGLALPADVLEGAVKRLVEAATLAEKRLRQTTQYLDHDISVNHANYLRAALRELGVSDE